MNNLLAMLAIHTLTYQMTNKATAEQIRGIMQKNAAVSLSQLG
jgi:hypothetical protein